MEKPIENINSTYFVKLPRAPPEIGDKVTLTGFGYLSLNSYEPSDYLQIYSSRIVSCYEDVSAFNDVYWYGLICVKTTARKHACPVSEYKNSE